MTNRFRLFLLSIIAIIGIAVFYFAYEWGALVGASEQLEIISEMRNTASIIFGVLGVWVAIVYPNELNDLFKKKKESSNTQILHYIFFSIRICTLIVLYSIVAGFTIPLARHIPKLIEHKDTLKMLNALALGASSYSLFICLLITFIPLEVANLDMNENKKADDDWVIVNRPDERKKSDS